MKWKEFLQDYFTFTRKERVGLLLVVLLILGILIFPKVSKPVRPNAIPPDTSWITAAKKLMTPTKDSGDQAEDIDDLAFNKPLPDTRGGPPGQLFYFDPNTLPVEGWKKLGIRDKTVGIIKNYLSKGGHFNEPRDLKKIYGIRPDEYERIEPYIRISITTTIEQSPANKPQAKTEPLSDRPKRSVVDVNTADTSAFIALPGIGSKLALRIINFRDKLGGFYSVDQIGETYGLADSIFQKIKPLLKLETISIKKININTATKDEMKAHPYLKWSLANAIVEYRNQHGNFQSPGDLKKINLISDSVYSKIVLYLVTQ